MDPQTQKPEGEGHEVASGAPRRETINLCLCFQGVFKPIYSDKKEDPNKKQATVIPSICLSEAPRQAPTPKLPTLNPDTLNPKPQALITCLATLSQLRNSLPNPWAVPSFPRIDPLQQDLHQV